MNSKSMPIVNPGSVGLQSRANGDCWALLGPDLELKVTPYDTRGTSERILKSKSPYKEDFAEHYLNPPYMRDLEQQIMA